MKRIVAIFTLIMIFATFTIPDAFASGIVEVDLVQSNAEMGNIFFDSVVPAYSAEIKCNSSTPYAVLMKSEVKDGSGTVIWENTENITL